MSRPQKIAQYIQRLAYESLIDHEDADIRPDDAPPRSSAPSPNYGAWNATSYSIYVPFRAPANS